MRFKITRSLLLVGYQTPVIGRFVHFKRKGLSRLNVSTLCELVITGNKYLGNSFIDRYWLIYGTFNLIYIYMYACMYVYYTTLKEHICIFSNIILSADFNGY